MSANIGFINGVFNSKMEQPGCHRIGFSYSSSVFTITGANGQALSDNNPGYVTVWNASPGKMVTYRINAPQSFEDASGTSVLTGNLFGLNTGVATSVDVPFFLYGCTNNAQDTLTFGISRIPHRKLAPAVADLGNPSTDTADTEYSMFLLDDVTLGDYDGNPVVLLGSFRMRMDASDDWTVQSLDGQDGIGRYNDTRIFTGLTGMYGANTGTFCRNNGGTAAVFTTNNMTYQIYPNGICYCNTELIGNAGGSGSGAVSAQTTVPFLIEDVLGSTGGQILGGTHFIRNGGTNRFIAVQGITSSHAVQYLRPDTTSNAYYRWVNWGANDRRIMFSLFYMVELG